MLLWVGFAVLSAAVLAALLNPLLRVPTGGAEAATAVDPNGDEREIALYRDQLTEVDAERERGQIGAVEAEAARAEIARRLLTAEDRARATGVASSLPSTMVRQVAITLMLVVPVMALGLYVWLGSPSMSAQPVASRSAPVTAQSDIERLIATVEARLKQHPEDGQGWDVIAPVYLRTGRYAEAADGFDRAIRLLGENPKRLAGLAESTVLANDGIVTEAAKAAYEKLHKLEPQRPEPRFWLALAKEQDGQLKDALADYQSLLKDGDPKAPWRPLVEERVAEVQQRLGAPDAAKAPVAKGAPAKSPETAKGPTPVDVAAAEKLAVAERQRMIEDMVQGLADRLAKEGRDLEGWQRLIRAYSVMGRKADAVAALGRARGNFATEPQSLTTLNELAKTLGLGS